MDKDRADITLDKVIELIKTPPLNRTKSESRTIQYYLCQNIDYFKRLTQDPDGNEKIPKIISVLNSESFKKGEHVIHFGEIGDKFYVILSGNVSIYKPSPKNINMTLREYVDYLVRIRDREKDLLKFERIQNYNSNIDKVQLLIINYNSSKLPYSTRKIPVVIEEERFLVKKGPGDYFGEMALTRNETRNANIIADEECEMISIERSDYRKIIKDLEEQKINSQIKNFKTDYPFFRDWPTNRCLRLLSSFDSDILSKGDYVYKQNSLANYIYIIKKGEFEVTSDINFSSYEQFIDYIYDSSNSLLKDMDNPLLWKEDIIQRRINNANENNKCPCVLTLPPIYKIILSHKITFNSNFTEKNTIENNETNLEKNNNLNEDNKANDVNYLNNDNQDKAIRRINIKKLEAPQIFGLIEPFELKRRFCNIKCNSREGIIQKMPFIEFLQLLPKDKKIRFILEQTLFNRKKEIIEQLKNGAMLKLSLNYRKPSIKSDNIYPGRNMDKLPKKKPKILSKSISFIGINHIDKIVNSKENIDKDNSNTINRDFPIKIRNNFMVGFKRSLFTFSKQKIRIIKGIMPVSLISQKNKSSLTIRKKDNIYSNNNSISSIKYLEENNSSTILPTKSSLLPIYDTTGKNYINSSGGIIMNKILFKNKDFEFTNNNNGKKNPEISLPSIETKKVENYSHKSQNQNNKIKQFKKRVSKSLLNNREYNNIFN